MSKLKLQTYTIPVQYANLGNGSPRDPYDHCAPPNSAVKHALSQDKAKSVKNFGKEWGHQLPCACECMCGWAIALNLGTITWEIVDSVNPQNDRNYSWDNFGLYGMLDIPCDTTQWDVTPGGLSEGKYMAWWRWSDLEPDGSGCNQELWIFFGRNDPAFDNGFAHPYMIRDQFAYYPAEGLAREEFVGDFDVRNPVGFWGTDDPGVYKRGITVPSFAAIGPTPGDWNALTITVPPSSFGGEMQFNGNPAQSGGSGVTTGIVHL